RGRHWGFQAGITGPADRRHAALAGQPRVHPKRRDRVAHQNVFSEVVGARTNPTDAYGDSTSPMRFLSVKICLSVGPAGLFGNRQGVQEPAVRLETLDGPFE